MLDARTWGHELAKALSVLAIVFLSFGHQNPPGLLGAQGPVFAQSNCGAPAPSLPLGGGDAHDHGCPVHHFTSSYAAATPPQLPNIQPRLFVARIVPADTGLIFRHFNDWSITPRAPPTI